MYTSVYPFSLGCGVGGSVFTATAYSLYGPATTRSYSFQVVPVYSLAVSLRMPSKYTPLASVPSPQSGFFVKVSS